MLIDTHCHINMIVKKAFDVRLNEENIQHANNITNEAFNCGVKKILNIGTSFLESLNSIELANKFANIFASIGIHPNDCTKDWHKELKELEKYLSKINNKIIAIGETGLDYHYPEYDKQRQVDAFKAQIELALQYNLALSIHTRDAGDEVLKYLDQFKDENLRGVIHCFSEDLGFAQDAINMGFVLGIGGTITYPKNQILRDVVKSVGVENIVLETDAPFLPPQNIRGQVNHPKEIVTIAKYVSELVGLDLQTISTVTTNNCYKIFGFKEN